jgi:hypothetical protein
MAAAATLDLSPGSINAFLATTLDDADVAAEAAARIGLSAVDLVSDLASEARLGCRLLAPLEPTRATRMLEVGAGAGVLAAFLRQQGADLVCNRACRERVRALRAGVRAARRARANADDRASRRRATRPERARTLHAHLLGKRARAHAAVTAEPRRARGRARTRRVHDPYVPERSRSPTSRTFGFRLFPAGERSLGYSRVAHAAIRPGTR